MISHYMADMTWEEFRDAVNEQSVLVIPMGSTELEGIHLPLGVDAIVADEVARRLNGEEGILLCPSLPVGYSRWFNPFPGTISLEHDTLTKVLVEYGSCLIRHGAKRLVFLNAHRGNNSCIEAASRILIAEYAVRIGMLSIWKLANDLTSGSGLIQEGKFTHAGEIMTSLIFAIKPDTVRKERMRADHVQSPAGSEFKINNSLGETSFKGSVQIVYQDVREVTQTGVMGDPTTASAEKGETILKLVVNYVKDYLQEFRRLSA
jgi:creatinine amidohydrolase